MEVSVVVVVSVEVVVVVVLVVVVVVVLVSSSPNFLFPPFLQNHALWGPSIGEVFRIVFALHMLGSLASSLLRLP